jgi:hypothetical protein
MSSISGNKNDDEVRRTREDYQTRDAKKSKKHALETKSTNEAHQAEIAEIKKNYEDEISTLKQKSQEALTRRDMEYQREIAEIRKMHSDQMKRTAADNEVRNNETERTLKSENARLQASSDTQKKNLSENYVEDVHKRDENMQKWADDSREYQQDAIVGEKERLNKAHQKEVKGLIEERNRRTEQGQMAYNQMRKGKDSTIAAQKKNFENQTERLTESYESSFRNHQEDDRVRDDMTRDSFQAGLDDDRERYRKAIDKEKDATEQARGAMADVVENRLGKKVTALEEEKHTEQIGRQRDQTKNEAKHKLEMNNLRTAFSRNIEDYERQKREMVNASNDKNQADMTNLSNKNSAAMYDQNKFFQEKIAMDKIRTDERFTQKEQDFDAQSQTANTSNESRFNKLKNYGELENQKLKKYFDEAGTTMRENFDTTLRDVRARNEEEKNKIFSSQANQSRGIEQKWTDKLNAVSLDYEKKIADIEDKHSKELKDQAYQYERIMTEKDKKSHAEFDTQTSQLSHRIAKNDEQHKRELDDLKRKHQETLANLLKNRQA